MPRQTRKKSSTGIYHIVLRGINQQIIFEDEEDNTKFIETLKTYKTISGYKIFAYCLMSNHFHLLMKEGKDDIALALKRITVSYVYWYNWKYSRRGHLFQDRFKSEPVENYKYLLTVLRYIHQNPIKAGICKELDEYEFSSYNCYLKEDSDFVDTDYIFSMISKEAFINCSNEKHNDECLEFDEYPNRLSDADAKEIIQKVTGCKNSSEFQALENIQRDEYIKGLRTNGLSIRQICRLTGISFAIVRKQ
jgi:REP element-mobilizing transposase RayT